VRCAGIEFAHAGTEHEHRADRVGIDDIDDHSDTEQLTITGGVGFNYDYANALTDHNRDNIADANCDSFRQPDSNARYGDAHTGCRDTNPDPIMISTAV
jgi:hypothetical protein